MKSVLCRLCRGLLLHIAHKRIALCGGIQGGNIHLVAHVQRKHIRYAVAHLHLAAIPGQNLLMAVLVGVAVAAACVYTIVVGQVQLFVAELVIAYHVGQIW